MHNGLLIIISGYIAAYVLGSIPFGLILGKLSGLGDIRKIGSGNIGATNMLRTGKKGLAAATLLLDGLKGFAAVTLANFIFTHYLQEFNADIDSLIYFSGIAAVLGHIFPIWLRFKGGKGVATAIGTFFAIDPLLGVAVCTIWLGVFLITKISSLSALSAFAFTTIATFIFMTGNDYSLYAAIVTVIIFYTHSENIKRLLKGEEHKWSKSK